jgi:uncharacterized coiled-coil protein SlyX
MQFQYAQPMAAGVGFPGLQTQSFPAQSMQRSAYAPAGGYTVNAPTVTSQPLTPKITSSYGTTGTTTMQGQTYSMTAAPGIVGTQKAVPVVQWPGQTATYQTAEIKTATNYMGAGNATSYMGAGNREQALEQRVRELENLLAMKEKTIQELENQLGKGNGNQKSNASKLRSPPKGFRKVTESKPVIRYSATDQDDPIDVRLEEFYNSTGSAIQFRRINRGFYRFGDSIVELDIINHKLMARTEDGWNRGKFGPIEKFLMYYENIEREKAGILPEC